ncbi:MAG: 50S ribosomal protein L24 [Candidatus Komeilibacteria bacterium]|nr:50S ribosomal protein L24 [Candidatus Komeilibacteria bacterium]
MKTSIKLNDQVRVIVGKDRGKTGKVIQVLPEDHMVVVEGVNKMFKHIRSPKRGEKGQRIEFAGPLRIGKVMLVCPKCGKPTRITVTRTGKKRNRICKKCKIAFE